MLDSWDQPTLVVKRRSKNPFGLINIVNKVVIELLLLDSWPLPSREGKKENGRESGPPHSNYHLPSRYARRRLVQHFGSGGGILIQRLVLRALHTTADASTLMLLIFSIKRRIYRTSGIEGGPVMIALAWYGILYKIGPFLSTWIPSGTHIRTSSGVITRTVVVMFHK